MFFLGANQHVYHFWSSPGSPWGIEDLTGSTSGAPLAAVNSPLTAFEDSGHNFREVFYLGANQHVYHFWATPGYPWGVEDLTGSTAGAPLAAAGSPLAAFEDDQYDFREVFYLGTNQHIYHFWAAPGYPWGVEDLTGSTPAAPLAIANSPLVAFEDSLHNFREVFYLGTNQHIYHFWATPGYPWGVEDLTGSTAGAPAATPGSALAAFENNLSDFREVFYLGGNLHEYHFWATPGLPWGIEDITAPTAGAPPAVAGSSLAAFAEAGIPELISGRVTAGGAGVAGAIVNLTGSKTATISADANGAYSFRVPPAGTYTVTPSASGDIFNPPSRTFGSTSGSQTANFANIGTVTITNVTHPSWGPSFAVGDTLQVALTKAAPNQTVSVSVTGSFPGTVQLGQTDSNGNYTFTGVERTSDMGSYTEIWSVGGVASTPAISFLVGQLGTGGTITTTDVGQTSDGNLQGVSTLSITNGVVSTYSATSLDYAASLYYDTNTVATLFDNGNQITQNVTGITTNTTTTLSATANAWDDYDLQTDHYAVAFYISGGAYANPYYWGDSCYAETGDCTISENGGFAYWVTVASIYVGSTLADQTYVPQDGSLPTFADSYAWNSFGSGQSLPSGPSLTVSKWEAAVLATAAILEIAESNYRKNNQNHSLPLLLELTDDPYVRKNERDRTYLIKDTTGRAWDHSHGDITIYEQFVKVFGTGGMPTPNNPAYGNKGWTKANQQITDAGYMVDQIIQLFPQPEVDYLQSFWATGISAPGLQLPPSIANLGLPGGALQIPLFIRDPISKCKHGDFSIQGIEINAQFIGVNGDGGAGTSCLPPQ